MYLLAESKTDIHCTVATAFTYATNMENFYEWFPSVLSIKSANSLNHGEAGKEYMEIVAVPLRGTQKITITVIESKRNQYFVTEGFFPPLLPRMEISFSSTGDESCQIIWRMFSRNQSVLARLTFLPIAKRIMSKRAVIGTSRLKQKLESN